MFTRRPSQLIKMITSALICLSLFGCGQKKIEKMPDNELVAKNNECLNMNDPAPAMIFACENYKKECERRRTEGKYIC